MMKPQRKMKQWERIMKGKGILIDTIENVIFTTDQ